MIGQKVLLCGAVALSLLVPGLALAQSEVPGSMGIAAALQQFSGMEQLLTPEKFPELQARVTTVSQDLRSQGVSEAVIDSGLSQVATYALQNMRAQNIAPAQMASLLRLLASVSTNPNLQASYEAIAAKIEQGDVTDLDLNGVIAASPT
jgi:hypothetical protein